MKLTTVPNAVSLLEARAPIPGFNSGQSAENVADHLRKINQPTMSENQPDIPKKEEPTLRYYAERL